MSPSDFVYTQIYKGALKAGASERQSQINAQLGLDEYKKGKFKKIADLINGRIKAAKKDTI